MSITIHRRIGTAGLVFGPLLFAVADLLRRIVDPSSSTPAVTAVARVHDRPGLWMLAGLLSALSAFLLIPGIAIAMAAVRARGTTLTLIGGYLFGIGVLASIGHMVAYFGLFGLYDSAGISSSTINKLESASYAPFDVFIGLFLVGMFLGLLLLVIGLRRAGVIPIWSVVAAIIAIVVGSTGGIAAGLIGIVAWNATFIPLAVSVARRDISSPIPAAAAH